MTYLIEINIMPKRGISSGHDAKCLCSRENRVFPCKWDKMARGRPANRAEKEESRLAVWFGALQSDESRNIIYSRNMWNVRGGFHGK